MQTLEQKKEYDKNYSKHYRKIHNTDVNLYMREYNKKYRKDNPLKYRNTKLKQNYGISLEEFNMLLGKQNGLCAICKINKGTHVDHSHDTKKVRGILCNNCNAGIGMLKDNINFLANAITYLENI